MRLLNKMNTLKLSLSVGLVLAFFSPIIAEELFDQKEAYQALTDNFLNPVPVWTQENDGFEEGSEAPKGWLTTYNEGPAGMSVISDVYAIDGDEACSKIAHFIYYFDQGADQTQRTAMLGNGKLMAGPIQFMGEDTYISIVQIETPEGILTMKDTAKIVDADTRSASAHFLNGETKEWEFADQSFWRRAAPDFQNPCQ